MTDIAHFPRPGQNYPYILSPLWSQTPAPTSHATPAPPCRPPWWPPSPYWASPCQSHISNVSIKQTYRHRYIEKPGTKDRTPDTPESGKKKRKRFQKWSDALWPNSPKWTSFVPFFRKFSAGNDILGDRCCRWHWTILNNFLCEYEFWTWLPNTYKVSKFQGLIWNYVIIHDFDRASHV